MSAADILLPLAGGLVLGAVFFGGLWLTVRRGTLSRYAALWFAGSSLLRTAAVMFGMYWLTAGDWRRLLPCVAGFYLARRAVTRFAGNPLATPTEDAHAS
jgi:F1F0 ATPase subunit 2